MVLNLPDSRLLFGGGGVIIISAVIEREENLEDSALAVVSFIKSILRLFEKNVKIFGVS
jgi:hypothetical protein